MINDAVGSCDVLLALIGEEWLTITDNEGRRRLDDPEDYVRLEVEAALARQVRVIPILVDGATMPRAEQLPPSLAKLVRRQALELSPTQFDFDTSRLLKVLDKTLTEIRAPAEPSERTGSGLPAGGAPIGPAPPPSPPTERVGPTAAAPVPPSPPTQPSRASRRRRGVLVAAGGAAVLVAAVLAIAVVLGGGDDEGGPTTIPLEVGAGPDGMAIDGDVMWVTDQNKDQVWRVNIETNKTIGKPIDEVGDQPDGVAAKGGTVWVANSDDSVTRLKVGDDGTVTPKNIDLEDPKTKPEGLALSRQWVWVATNEPYVARIDRASATLHDSIPIGKGTVGVFVDEDEDGVYVSDNGGHTVTRLDPDTGQKMWGEPTTVGHKPRGLVKADGSIWVANSKDNTVSRLSSSTGEVLRRRIRVGQNPRDVTYAGGFIWVANTSSNTVTKIDPRSESVVDEIPVGTTPASIVAGAGSVWVSNSDDGTLTRIEP